MVSCSWSLNLALGFPQPVLQEAAFQSWWYCSSWFCNFKTLLSVELEFMAAHHKTTKRERAFAASCFWNCCWENSGAQSCYFIGGCSFCTGGRKPLQTLFSSIAPHLIRPSIPLSLDIFLSGTS